MLRCQTLLRGVPLRCALCLAIAAATESLALALHWCDACGTLTVHALLLVMCVCPAFFSTAWIAFCWDGCAARIPRGSACSKCSKSHRHTIHAPAQVNDTTELNAHQKPGKTVEKRSWVQAARRQANRELGLLWSSNHRLTLSPVSVFGWC